jgi:hypothetical protein
LGGRNALLVSLDANDRAAPVLAWVMLTGFCIAAPWAAAEGLPDGLDALSTTWLVVGGLANVVGLLLA